MFQKTITLGQAMAAFITIAGSLITFGINTNVRLSALEMNKSIQDNNYIESKASFKSINDKLDKLSDVQNEIKLSLKDKQDRVK